MRTVLTLSLITLVLGGAYSLTTAITTAPVPVEAPVTAPPIRPPYLILCILRDRSGSTRWHRTDDLDADDLDRILTRVKASGGQVGFGEVDETSDAPLLRLTIDPPPIPPTLEPLSGDLTEAAQRKHAFSAAEDAYYVTQRAWIRTATPKITAFRTAVVARLGAPRTAQRTNYSQALRRVTTFFGEPIPKTVGTPPVYLILVLGDGIDTVTRTLPPSIAHEPIVLVVNGYGQTGQLAAYHPVTFESADSAVNFIVATTEGASHD